LQELYDSEINFIICTFWDGGLKVKLGDDYNGFKAEGLFESMIKAVQYLKQQAIDFFPDSEFAKKHK